MSDSTSNQETNPVDNRAVLGQGALQAREGSNIAQIITTNTIDPGSFALAGKVVDQLPGFAQLNASTALNLYNSALDFARQSSDTAATAINQAGNFTAAAYADAKGSGKSDQLMFAIIAVAALAVVFALKGRA